MRITNRTVSLWLALACLLTISRSANAYIDAGSGSYLLQILFAGLLAGLYGAKAFFFNMKSAIVRKVNNRKREDSVTHVS